MGLVGCFVVTMDTENTWAGESQVTPGVRWDQFLLPNKHFGDFTCQHAGSETVLSSGRFREQQVSLC